MGADFCAISCMLLRLWPGAPQLGAPGRVHRLVPGGPPTIDTRTFRCHRQSSGRAGLAANLRRTATPLGAPSVPTNLTNRVGTTPFGLISMPTPTPQPVTVPPSNLPGTRVSARTS